MSAPQQSIQSPLSDCPKFLIDSHPLVRHKLSLLRDKNTPQPQFSMLVREITHLLGYSVTQNLNLVEGVVESPLCSTKAQYLKKPSPLIVPILRAGLGMVTAFTEMLPASPVIHLGIRRNEKTLEPEVYYAPELKNHMHDSPIFLLDPMLATGGSIRAAVMHFRKFSRAPITCVSLLAAPEGVRYLCGQFPDLNLVCAGLDEKLNNSGYIVPGLGDAGDRQFGTL